MLINVTLLFSFQACEIKVLNLMHILLILWFITLDNKFLWIPERFLKQMADFTCKVTAQVKLYEGTGLLFCEL